MGSSTTLSEAAASEYWLSPAGIRRRVDMLSQSFTHKVVNNALIIYGETGGITRWRWATNPGASKTGPCPYCAAHSGRIYRKGQFLPPLPAHAGCVCGCELMVEPGKPPQYVF